MLFLLCILINSVFCANSTQPKKIPVTYEKYITYDWDIATCCNGSEFVVTKNNQTYLTIFPQPCSWQCRGTVSIPWCAFQYNPLDIYEWYVTHDCNKTESDMKFSVGRLDTYYATNNKNSYIIDASEIHKKYIVIEIPHFKNSLMRSCLTISTKMISYDHQTILKIHNDANACDYNIFSNNYYIADFQTIMSDRWSKTLSSNMTIGCTYPSQKGSFDVSPGKKYIMQIDSHYKINIDLEINTMEPSNVYELATLILGSILLGVIVLILLTTACMLYLKYRKVDPTYVSVNSDNHDNL